MWLSLPNKSPKDSYAGIWLAHETDILPADELSGQFRLSRSETRRLQRIGSAKKKREFVASRTLIRIALADHFAKPASYWQIDEREDAPPKIANAPQHCFSSLSHSNGKLCYALADHPIGVDIEANDKPRDFLSLAKAFCNAQELMKLQASKNVSADFFACVTSHLTQ